MLQSVVAVLVLFVGAKFSHALDITVQPASGAPLTISTEPGDSILNVKQKIELQNGVPPSQQELKFGGTTLDDNQTVADYNIQKGDTLDLTVIAGPASAPGGNALLTDAANSISHLIGSTVQSNFNTSTFQFQFLKQQVALLAADQKRSDLLSSSALASNGQVASASFTDQAPVQTVSYQDEPFHQAAHTETMGRHRNGSCGRCEQSQIHGWTQSYVIGGGAESRAGVAGYDYSAFGTQLGIARSVDDQTLLGMFGNYGYQDVGTLDASQSITNGGLLGAFLYRADDEGNDYLIAATGGFNEYTTLRQPGVRGEFSGGQTGFFMDRGWTRRWGSAKVRPSIALQHLWVHHNAFTETGAGGASVDEVNEHSLRSIIGLSGSLRPRKGKYLGYTLRPTAHAHWVHEYLDSATTITGIAGGTQFAVTGLDAGRDWAFMGLGLTADRGDAVSLYAAYDAQFATYLQLHTASIGIMLSR
ncbi:MAG: hypothetical protein Aurels2KO_41730 [Aureliella sp.]